MIVEEVRFEWVIKKGKSINGQVEGIVGISKYLIDLFDYRTNLKLLVN